MVKRICISKTGLQTAFYSHSQGWDGHKQNEMIGYIRSTGKSLNYYLIADDNTFEGL